MSRFQNYADVLSQYIKSGCDETDEQELRHLAKSTVSRIRTRVAENPRIPPDVLEMLAVDEDADVRAALASNPSTPISIINKLAEDEDPSVRWSIAEDPRTPIWVLEGLSDDGNAYVRVRAEKTLTALRTAQSVQNKGAGGIIRTIKKALSADPQNFQYA